MIDCCLTSGEQYFSYIMMSRSLDNKRWHCDG